jgi:processive 1,2-diacylglycerol beta-glucosyltransferase
MLPFQNTNLYKDTLKIFSEFLEDLDIQKDPVLKNVLQEKIFHFLAEFALALNKEDKLEQQKYLNNLKEKLYSLVTLIEIASKTKSIDIKKASNFCEQLSRIQSLFSTFSKTRKRILILSISVGQGHLSASKAIKEGLENLYGYDFDVQIIDFGKVLSTAFNKATIKAYEGSIKYAPTLYKFFFENTDKKWQVKLLNMMNYPFCVNRLKKFFEDKQPDLILSTHPFWDYIASRIWKKQNPEAKFLSVITDSILIHNSWIIGDTDYHIVPNKDTAITLKKMGIKDSKIKILGFPVKLKFLKKTNRQSFLSGFELDPKLFTVVFLATIEGSKKACQIVQEILDTGEKLNLIVIAGNNKNLMPKLRNFKDQQNVRILGWSDQVPEFIQSSDVVITKAGGATVMECIAAQKPMVITQILPGQEQGNAELVKRYQIGLIPSLDRLSLWQSVLDIRKNRAKYQKNLENISNPGAALEIAKFIHEII